ncbi:DUF6678 family protein [Aquimarina aquimarini]|uniref:DUF6678 family protein n=1 Tax=Aquimarina aquimarini TaxID=1191734 RepID=UPI000D56174F|nr:DUF6678 family protein [Aquimarina aquimarini]
MTNKEKYNLYKSTNAKAMTRYEQYKYFTENDKDIVKLKQEIEEIVVRKNLSSIMNDTKWLELQKRIETLPFPPAYNEKLMHWEKREFIFNNLKNEPGYLGDWSNYWEEGFPIFFTIEWLEIRPKHRKNQGRLVPPKIVDETEELIQLLNNLNIPFEQNKGSIIIYGYK